MSASDNSKRLDRIEKAVERLEALITYQSAILVDIVNKMDIQSTAEEKKPQKERKLDILTFVKSEYSKNQDFFGKHIPDDQKDQIISAIPVPKKTLTSEERLKKEAMAIWKVVKVAHQAFYTDLKLKSINGQNSDVPIADGSRTVIVDGDLGEDDDE